MCYIPEYNNEFFILKLPVTTGKKIELKILKSKNEWKRKRNEKNERGEENEKKEKGRNKKNRSRI